MRVLVVDSDDARRASIAGILTGAGYGHVLGSGDVAAAHDLCAREAPDAVLLDLDVPAASDHALARLQHLTEPPRHLPVVVLTADLAPPTRRHALRFGVRDFIGSPVDETELLLRVHNVLRTRRAQQQLEDRDAILGDALRERRSDSETTRESLAVLTAISEYHDEDTQQHPQRVGIGAALIAEALGLPDAFVTMIRDAAPLHDIGKVGISRRILLKPDKLTPAEWEHMMRHVEIGGRILGSARSPVLRLAAEIARSHHERWDGDGYLAGLAGEAIPIAARITAVADVWDTLTHERPYKRAWDPDQAFAEILASAGTHFDPRVVHAFGTIDWAQLDSILGSQLVHL